MTSGKQMPVLEEVWVLDLRGVKKILSKKNHVPLFLLSS